MSSFWSKKEKNENLAEMCIKTSCSGGEKQEHSSSKRWHCPEQWRLTFRDTLPRGITEIPN